MMNKRKKIAVTFSVLSFPVMLFFQNCGQAGNIGVNSASNSSLKTTSSAAVAGDTLVVIDLPVESDPIASAPAESEPVASLPVADLPADSDPVSPVVAETPAQCSGLQVSDILLKVNAIKADTVCIGGGVKRAATFEIIDADSSISLDKLTLQVKATTSGDVKELFLGLEKTGNKILSSDNKTLELKTSDIETAGMKIKLKSEYKVEAGKTYLLKFNLKSASGDSSHCEVKPEFKEALLFAAN